MTPIDKNSARKGKSMLKSTLIGGQMLLAVVFGMPGCKRETSETTPSGAIAPEIVGLTLDGKEMTLSQYRGKVTLLSFWFSTCRPCVAVMPAEKALAAKYSGRPFQILGVNADTDRETGQEAAETKQLTWPSWYDEGSIIAQKYGVTGYPTFILVDHKGVIQLAGNQNVLSSPLIEKLVSQAEGGK